MFHRTILLVGGHFCGTVQFFSGITNFRHHFQLFVHIIILSLFISFLINRSLGLIKLFSPFPGTLLSPRQKSCKFCALRSEKFCPKSYGQTLRKSTSSHAFAICMCMIYLLPPIEYVNS